MSQRIGSMETRNPESKAKAGFLITRRLCGALMLVVAAGCSHHHHDYTIEGPGFARVYTPQVPTFMLGPAGALLTNNPGYTARATIIGEPSTTKDKPVEGELLCRGTKLLFAPRGLEDVEKDSPARGFSYVWDVTTGSGHIRSEALQAYAPVSTTLRITNISPPVAGGAPMDITVTMSDGSKSVFHISGDARTGNLPTQIKSESQPQTSISLAKVRTQPPPEDSFSVPPGFTKYASAEALADELAARQHNLRRGAPMLPGASDQPEVIRH